MGLEKVALEGIWQRINCLVPSYDSHGGNSTKIYLDDNTILYDQRRLIRVLNDLAGIFVVDISKARKKYSGIVGKKNAVPLPLHQQMVLFPVKMRKPIAKEDGAWGYIVLEKVSEHFGCPNKQGLTKVHFKSGSGIEVLLADTSFQLSLEKARVVKDAYLRLHLGEGAKQIKEEQPVYVTFAFTGKKQFNRVFGRDRQEAMISGLKRWI